MVIVKLSEAKLALRGFEQANCSCSSRGRQCFDRRVVAWHNDVVGAVDWVCETGLGNTMRNGSTLSRRWTMLEVGKEESW